ncbi:hypothetical protein [Microlunatus ginsengisoli]|uniref:Uncharacterized protein n=1 Tax=Microlunatus ginsengisoli TaxID=363863 RepID=A0ABP6ZXD0_9ACTN
MTAAAALAPPAPGRLGVAVEALAAQNYLAALGEWRTARKTELDRLDRAALDAGNSAATGDIMLSMALWKAISDRYELMLATWDSGRVGPTERERLSALIWGRIDTNFASPGIDPSGLAVSTPEACRLSDALAASLRVRLGLDGGGLDLAERIRALRAQLERIRDQVGLEPAGPDQQLAAQRQAKLAGRLQELIDKAGRGGDVGGLIGPLEADATRFERDLIVHSAQRREAGAIVARARAMRRDLEAREAALHAIVERCVAAVDPAPKYAVPDVDALGPMPNTAEPLKAYVARLEQVGKAMTLAQGAYLQALARREELDGRLEAYRAKAAAEGVDDDPDLGRAYALARDALDRTPTRIPIAEQLVTLYQSYLQVVRPAAGTTGGGS